MKIERIAVRTSMFAHSNILSRYHIPRAKFPNPLIHPSIRSTTDFSFMAICQYYTVRIQNSLTGTVHLTHIITVAVIKTNAAMSVHSTAFLSRISSYLNGKYSISPASKLNKPIHFISLKWMSLFSHYDYFFFLLFCLCFAGSFCFFCFCSFFTFSFCSFFLVSTAKILATE